MFPLRKFLPDVNNIRSFQKESKIKDKGIALQPTPFYNQQILNLLIKPVLEYKIY